MKKIQTITVYFVTLTFVAVFSGTKAESFDPEAISQVSKGIAEWKLMNEDSEQTQSEQTVYVSSSLSGTVERGSGGGVGVVKGLAAFDNNDYWIRSELRNWELNAGIEASNRYGSRLPTNPWVDVAGDLTTRGIGIAYDQYMHNQLAVVNVLRNYQGNAALATFPRSWQIASATYDIASSTMGAGITFAQTIDRVGTSMQIINPPIYLQNDPDVGQIAMFTPSQKILGIIPVSGTWEGSGSYRIPSGIVNYQETFKTSGEGFITQTHTDWATTNHGTSYRHIEIKTPATSGFERVVVTYYPVGRYSDLQTSTITTTTVIQQSYRIETYTNGATKVTPLSNSGIGTWGSGGWSAPPPTLNATWKTVKIGSTTYKYPSIDWTSIPKTTWTIPNTNPLPIYTPSIPKMPTYTTTISSSSWGRKY